MKINDASKFLYKAWCKFLRLFWRVGIFILRLWRVPRYFYGHKNFVPSRYSIFEGKKIAVVGNAESIFDSEYGELIDSMDVIVRINHGVISRTESQGSRTHILAMSCRMPEKDLVKNFNPEIIYWMTPKWMGMWPYSKDLMRRMFFFPKSDWSALYISLGHARPSTGFMITTFILSSSPAEIHLFGFDFGASKTFYNDDSYVSPHNYIAEKNILRNHARENVLVIHQC